MRNMRNEVALVCCLLLSYFCSSLLADDVKLTVDSLIPIGTTDDPFICATLDWWPEDKCDYGQCPWGKAGILNLDLNNKIFINAVKAFKNLRIRIGGSLEDQIVYQVGQQQKCPAFQKNPSVMFGFTGGCLPMYRWDQLNQFFQQTGVKVTFGLNALNGRERSGQGNLWVGDWDAQNARDFIAYTVDKGYKIDSWELGNELCGGGVGARVEANQYAKDTIQLKNIVNELYVSPFPQPKILGPAGFYDKYWYDTYLQAMGPGVIDGITHHIYNLGAGVDKDLITKVQNPLYLDEIAPTFHDVERTVELFSPMAEAWVGEAGGAYNSGGKDVSPTFADGFWYLDQLGMSSTFRHKVYCRQALVGGNYALLNTTSFIPNPDYYGALLWHRLMGGRVLSVKHNGSPKLRTYAHCSKNGGGISVLLINMSNSTTFKVRIDRNLNYEPSLKGYDLRDFAGSIREEYHLTPAGGNIQSEVVLLNGTPLKLTETLDIPELKPNPVDPLEIIRVAPDSIVFAELKGFKAPVCGVSAY